MQYSPKLKQAMEEIKAVLKKYDLAAFAVVNDGKGMSEYLHWLSPSWSCVKIIPPQVRLQARLKEDFNGDKDRQVAVIESTTSMLHAISAVTHREISHVTELSKMMDERFGAEHDEGTHTGHSEVSN